MLCLSCIVVFCTIYVLILPAITLEKKTTCEEEQSAIQEEQNLVQEEDESTVQGDDSDEVEFVSCEPIEEENENVEDVEIAEDPEEEMDVDFASGEEDGIAAAADEAVMPEAGAADGFDLSAAGTEAAEKRKSVKLSYKKADGTWQEFSQEEVSGNPPVKLEVEYEKVQISNLLKSYNRKLTYQLPDLLRNVTTAGKIMEGSQQVGTVTCQDGKIVVEFDEPYLQGLLNKGDTTIAGDFYAEGKINLSQLNPDGTTTLSTADKNYQLNFGPDAVAK